MLKVVPGPDVAIANNDHEDIENTRESEMIEAAMNLDKSIKMKKLSSNEMADSHKTRREIPSQYVRLLVVFHKSMNGLYTPAFIRISSFRILT